MSEDFLHSLMTTAIYGARTCAHQSTALRTDDYASPFGKMGKLRLGEEEPKGQNQSKVTQWKLVKAGFEPCAVGPPSQK